MPLPLIALAAKLLPFASAIPEVMRAFGSDKSADAAEKLVDVAKGISGESTPESAVNKVIADPALQLQLQQALITERLEFVRLEVEDRKSARERDKAFVATGRSNYRADLLAFLAVAGLIICVYFVATNPGLPPGAREAIMFVAGVLASAVRDVYGFEFGSSRGSKEKDQLMAELKRP